MRSKREQRTSSREIRRAQRNSYIVQPSSIRPIRWTEEIIQQRPVVIGIRRLGELSPSTLWENGETYLEIVQNQSRGVGCQIHQGPLYVTMTSMLLTERTSKSPDCLVSRRVVHADIGASDSARRDEINRRRWAERGE